MSIRKNIVDHLKKKGNYEEVDEYDISLIIENMKFAKELKDDLDVNGCVIDITTGNGFTTRKINPALNAYQMCLRNIHQAASKLGLSRKDRLALKLVEDKEIKDELANIIDE